MPPSPAHSEQSRVLDAMPGYRSLIANAMGDLESGAPVDLARFAMAYREQSPWPELAAHLDGCSTLLDLGCGCGAALVWLAQRSEDLRAAAGVDLLHESIQVAQALVKRTMPDDYRLAFMQHDIAALSVEALAEGSGLDRADGVFALNSLFHLSEQQRESCLRFVAQALAPEGRLYIEDLCTLRALDDAERELLQMKLACPYLPNREQFADRLSAIFDDAVVLPEDISTEYAMFADLQHQEYAGEDEDRREHLRVLSVLLTTGAVGAVRIKLVRE